MNEPRVGDGTDDSITTSFDLLRHPHRRTLVRYLYRTQSDVVDTDDLLEFLDERAAGTGDAAVERRELAMALHHVHLPQLADAGVVEYESATDAVRVDRAELTDRLEDVRTTVAALQDAER